MTIEQFMSNWGFGKTLGERTHMRSELQSVVDDASREAYNACARKVIADSERRVAELESMPGARGER